MEKKVKDLTADEMTKICTEYFICSECPLNINGSKYCLNSFFYKNTGYYKRILNKRLQEIGEEKIEVGENGKR